MARAGVKLPMYLSRDRKQVEKAELVHRPEVFLRRAEGSDDPAKSKRLERKGVVAESRGGLSPW